MPGAESDKHKHEEIPGEKEEEEEVVERFESHIENMTNEFLSCDSTCNELPDFISEADIIALGWPEEQPNCEICESCEHIQDESNPQSVSSTVSTESDSPSALNYYLEFEMKKQFDLVLKELNLFFDISINDVASDGRASSPEQCNDMTEALEGDTSVCKDHLSSSELGRHRDTSLDDTDDSLCGGDPVVCRTTGSCDGEQEVPLGSHMCQETSVYTSEKHREPREIEQRRKMWSPSFVCPPFLDQQSLRPPEQPKRLQPLRTCTRPIRVGLSKRAKTKHLHHPHPYR
ncbi:RAD51-associated protein 2-like [Lates japonicus]